MSKEKILKARECYMTSKEDILQAIDLEKKRLDKKRFGAPWEVAFIDSKIQLLCRFEERIQKRKLLTLKEDNWAYRIEYKSRGIILYLKHFRRITKDESGFINEEIDESYSMDAEKSKLLTIEQYAEQYKVETVTVRQWIRRGKIKTALKLGKEWRIPELTPMPSKGYMSGQYRIDCAELTDIPKEYEFVRDYNFCSIYQDSGDLTMFNIILYGDGGEQELKWKIKEKEAFELFLIASPAVEYLSEQYGEIEK